MEMARDEERYVINPRKFLLWLFIVTVILLFGSLTSAYIVAKGTGGEQGNWIPFTLPNIMWVTTAVVILSSVTAQWATWAAKKENLGNARLGYFLTILLGLFFLVGQGTAWYRLVQDSVMFADTNSASFLYVLTGAHGLHIIAGMIYLVVVWLKRPTRRAVDKMVLNYENSTTFWHFLSLLWIYLFIFLLINQT